MDIYNTALYKHFLEIPVRRIVRIFILVLIMLVAVDIIIAQYVRDVDYEHYYRLPEKDTVLFINPYIKYVHSLKAEQPKLIFIGDSILYGSPHNSPEKSIPYFYQNISGTKVYNFAIVGSKTPDKYLIMKNIIDSADIVIFNIHYEFFVNIRDPPIAHKEFVDLPLVEESDVKRLDIDFNTNKNIENFLESTIATKWYLYSRRIPLFEQFFRMHPRTWLREEYSKLVCRIQFNTSFCGKPPLQFMAHTIDEQNSILEEYKNTYEKTGIIHEDSINLFYLKKIAMLANNSGKKVVAIMIPTIPAFNERYNITEQSYYKKNLQIIRSVLEDGGIRFIDYNIQNLSIGSRFYQDPEHFISDGDRIFAQILYEDTRNIIFGV